MASKDFQAEELLVAIAVGLPLHRLDLVVSALQRAGRDRVGGRKWDKEENGGKRWTEGKGKKMGGRKWDSVNVWGKKMGQRECLRLFMLSLCHFSVPLSF